VNAATATATIEVPCDPVTAFEIFTGDIGTWWKRDSRHWNDPARAVAMRLDPHAGGRFVEVYDAQTGEGFEIGRVLAWEPGKRLVLTWGQASWQPPEVTEVEVRFEAAGHGTRVTVEHSGWDRVRSAGPRPGEGYGEGWSELLGLYAQAV
jgi:uncharacterized protein YndB with AHSA1/START domain